MSRFLPLAAFALITAAACAQEPSTRPASRPASRPGALDVLVLLGGRHHDFDVAWTILRRSLPKLGSYSLVPVNLVRDAARGNALLAELPGGRFDVVLAYTQGPLALSAEARAALLGFVEGGGGYVAVHSAGDSHHGWEAYDRMLGGRFASHPPLQRWTVDVGVRNHPVTHSLPERFEVEDEFYHLKGCRPDDKLVLMSGESPGDGSVRPVSWVREHGAGRVFYTILGHDARTQGSFEFQRLVANALDWAADAPLPDAEGWYRLFDGGSLAGWTQSGPGGFAVEGGTLVARGGMGLLWYHRRRFRDFTLSLEWKAAERDDNSGVFVRFPEPPESPWDAVKEGYEVQICDAGGPKHRTGSIYDFADADDPASLPPGSWNALQITVRGQRYTVLLNGRRVTTFTGERGREGYVGLQNHDDGSPVRFRNVRARPLDG